MTAPGAILLIACYELGRPPLSIAGPAGVLARAGYALSLLDASIESLDPERLRAARFVGIAVPMHTALRLGMRVLERVRAVNPAAHVCFYGHYAALNAAYLLAHGADSAIGGEYDGPLLDLVRSLAEGCFEGEPVSGVSDRRRIEPPVMRRTAFAPPARDALPELSRYAHLDWEGREHPAAYVEASRGCKHRCLHCPITPVYDGRFFAVPAEVVLADVDTQVAAGARHVTFGDPDFLNGPTHALRLARALHARHPTVTFDFTAKVEHLLRYRSLLPELRACGCLFIVSAIESFSDVVLARLEKGHTAAEIETALVAVREAGIWMRPSLVAFTPWTTRDDYRRMLERIAALDLVEATDAVQYSIRLLVPPGSALLNRPETRSWLGELDDAAFLYRWSHPDPAMDRLHTAVAARVEAATRPSPRTGGHHERSEGSRDGCPSSESAWNTFAAVCELAELRIAGQVFPNPQSDTARSVAIRNPQSTRPPRLTEAWFC